MRSRGLQHRSGNVQVLNGGLHSLMVAHPGRIGYWRVGIPPSGPMDDYSFRIANRILNNHVAPFSNAAGLELTYKGPKLQFDEATTIVLTGAKIKNANLNETRDLAECWYQPIAIASGDVLDLSDTNIDPSLPGCRTYLAIANGGFTCDEYLGSKTSFPMGRFGGPKNDGAVLQEGDMLQYMASSSSASASSNVNSAELNRLLPDYISTFIHPVQSEGASMEWEIGVLAGPQSSPDYLTPDDVQSLYATQYEVTHNASRLGIRLHALNARKFSWARSDGGEGGSHPSNLIDNAYAIGSVNFTGDSPVILTVDGPSLGGFVCPITIASSELWKVGQLKPGDRLRFKLRTLQQVVRDKQDVHEHMQPPKTTVASVPTTSVPTTATILRDYAAFEEPRLEAVLYGIDADLAGNQPKVQYRIAGDRYLLIDYGDDEIDLNLRVRAHKLEQYLLEMIRTQALCGIVDTIPGVKTLLIEYDSTQVSLSYLLQLLLDVERNYLCPTMDLSQNDICLPSKTYRLPLAFNDEWTQRAIDRYMQEVREKAAYLPSNTQFICNNNGLEGGIAELERKIYDMSFLVLGLGDVYLGAPCAIPMDPRHRLNVPKYNPSRNFTPEGAVGIGGKFMCIYPMESPGGYQLIGRTLQIFNKNDSAQKPWLLNMFDQVQFHRVTADELMAQRADIANGAWRFDVVESEFNLNEYNRRYVDDEAVQSQVQQFKKTQKVFQAQQLQYDKFLLEQDATAYNDIICEHVLWYQANMIVNGPKYGTSFYIFAQEYFENSQQDFQVAQQHFITPLHKFKEQEMEVTLYNKLYAIKFMSAARSRNENDGYDVVFAVNGNEYRVRDIAFGAENANYVCLDEVDGAATLLQKSAEIEDEERAVNYMDDPSVELICSALPGKLVKLHVKVGDDVKVGDVLATVSAMKMETAIHSHATGKVLFVNRNEIVPAKAVIAHIAK